MTGREVGDHPGEATVVDLGAADVVPAEGIHSRALVGDGRARMVSMALAAGEELSEHAASSTATIVILRGRADLELGERTVAAAGPGTWVLMPPGLRHAVRAREPTVLLLTLLRDGGGPAR
jgi:quercetin dioxygenase-like cupin family protein